MAAYRSGNRLVDRTSGRVADYSRRNGVVHAEIMAPEGTAAWLRDRDQLWNGVEEIEKRKDAQLAREMNLALPHELDAEQRLELVRSFVAEHFVGRGMVADIALHEPVVKRGDDARNFHAHVMLTMRQATPQGLNPVKTREWNSDSMLIDWRQAWSEAQNRALERAGRGERVDHRTLGAQQEAAKARGDRVAAAQLDRQPELHEGPRARKAAQEGKRTPTSQRFERSTARPRDGRWTSGKTAAKRWREIDYTRIDQGSRSEASRTRVAARELASARRQERLERQSARVRDKMLRLERSLRALPLARSRRLEPVQNRQAVAHRQRRVAQALWLVRGLEQLMIGLMARRQADRSRLAELVRAHDIRRALGLARPREGLGRDRQR